MCACECCISGKSMHSSLLTWHYCHLKHLKDRSNHSQNIRSSELLGRLFETYKNSVRLHGCYIYNSSADMDIENLCPCPSQYHGIPHWKCVLRCFDKCLGISIPRQETNKYATKTCSTIQYHVYRNISRCTVHSIRPYKE